MTRGIAPARVVSFILLVVAGALCQSTNLTFPDNPAIQKATSSKSLGDEFARNQLASLLAAGPTQEFRDGEFLWRESDGSSAERSNAALARLLNRPSPKQLPNSLASASGSLMGRATAAASRVLVTRDETGKGRLNTSYLLRTLTSVAADTASRPYWRRSVGEPFSDFGSTVGSDAGMNLWHEFGPSIEQLMKSHTPKFVVRLEEHIGK